MNEQPKGEKRSSFGGYIQGSVLLTCSEGLPWLPWVTLPPSQGPDAIVGICWQVAAGQGSDSLFCTSLPTEHSPPTTFFPKSRERGDKNTISIWAWVLSNSCQQTHSFHTCPSAWEERGLGTRAHISWAKFFISPQVEIKAACSEMSPACLKKDVFSQCLRVHSAQGLPFGKLALQSIPWQSVCMEILREKGPHEITARDTIPTSEGLRFLLASCSPVAECWASRTL